VLSLIPTTQASLVALRSGDVDVAELDPVQLPLARQLAGVRVIVTPVNGEHQLILSATTPPTSDVAVRRAIGAAVDREELARGSFGALTPADSFLPPVFAWHDPAPQTLRADPGLVTRVLTGAGYRKIGGWWTLDGKRLEVTIDMEPERDTSMQIVEQEQLRRAGIEASLKSFPASQFNAADGPLRTGHFTAAAAQWIGAADPEQSVTLACSQRGGNGNNSSNYCNPRFDALFEDQATTSDEARRRRDFIEMQRIARDDEPVVPLAFQSVVDALRDRVTGFHRNMLMYPVDAQTWDTR
jgi:ABC-type transport system substrate-binding protein